MTDRANIVETLQRYAPEHYDWMSDDMTVPFAIELAKKDAEIERLRAALDLIGNGPHRVDVTEATQLAWLKMKAREAISDEQLGDGKNG